MRARVGRFPLSICSLTLGRLPRTHSPTSFWLLIKEKLFAGVNILIKFAQFATYFPFCPARSLCSHCLRRSVPMPRTFTAPGKNVMTTIFNMLGSAHSTHTLVRRAPGVAAARLAAAGDDRRCVLRKVVGAFRSTCVRDINRSKSFTRHSSI